MPEPLIVRPNDAPRPLNIVGEQLTILASGAQTGSYEIFLQVGPEGSGPPPHSHPWDEAFYVTKGEVDFALDGGAPTTATPGTLVHVPAGTTHWFRFKEGGGEMLSVTSREAASKMFTDIDREVDSENPDLVKLAEVGGRHSLTVA